MSDEPTSVGLEFRRRIENEGSGGEQLKRRM